MGKKCNTTCCVFGCKSKKSATPSLHFHHFPKLGANKVAITNKFGEMAYVDRRLAWIRVLRMAKPVTKNMVVCSCHFKQSDYILYEFFKTRPRLRKDVIPSMNLPTS